MSYPDYPDFLERICNEYNINGFAAQVLMCFPNSATKLTQEKLLDLYNEKYPENFIGLNRLKQLLTELYKNENFGIPDGENNKLRFVQKYLIDKYQKWKNEYGFFSRVGFNNLHSRFPPVETFQEKLKEVIDLKDEEAKKIDIFQTFAPNLPYYSDQLIKCIKNGVSTRILLAWPFSEAAKLREEALKKYSADTHADINIENEVMRNLVTLENILTAVGKTDLLQIKLYDTSPSVAIYRSGNYLLHGLFLHGKLAVKTVYYEYNLDAPDATIINDLINEFNAVWDSAREFSPNPGTNWRNIVEILFMEVESYD